MSLPLWPGTHSPCLQGPLPPPCWTGEVWGLSWGFSFSPYDDPQGVSASCSAPAEPLLRQRPHSPGLQEDQQHGGCEQLRYHRARSRPKMFPVVEGDSTDVGDRRHTPLAPTGCWALRAPHSSRGESPRKFYLSPRCGASGPLSGDGDVTVSGCLGFLFP